MRVRVSIQGSNRGAYWFLPHRRQLLNNEQWTNVEKQVQLWGWEVSEIVSALLFAWTLTHPDPNRVFLQLPFALSVKTTQNSTGGTGTHSAGKLTKTEVDGKEDSWLWEREEDKPLFISFSQISVCFITGC